MVIECSVVTSWSTGSGLAGASAVFSLMLVLRRMWIEQRKSLGTGEFHWTWVRAGEVTRNRRTAGTADAGNSLGNSDLGRRQKGGIHNHRSTNRKALLVA